MKHGPRGAHEQDSRNTRNIGHGTHGTPKGKPTQKGLCSTFRVPGKFQKIFKNFPKFPHGSLWDALGPTMGPMAPPWAPVVYFRNSRALRMGPRSSGAPFIKGPIGSNRFRLLWRPLPHGTRIAWRPLPHGLGDHGRQTIGANMVWATLASKP